MGGGEVAVPEDTRDQLRDFCLSAKRRRIGRPPDEPSEWTPTAVIDPRSGCPFTFPGAWEFISQMIDGGAELEPITLDKPPGQTGYVLKAPGGPDRPEIYIKLQLGPGYVTGRSFHYSNRNPAPRRQQ